VKKAREELKRDGYSTISRVALHLRPLWIAERTENPSGATGRAFLAYLSGIEATVPAD
jgi:hypothetical protein